jgi:hypothetical protein
MTRSTAMKGEKIYEIEHDLTGVTGYGVSMDALLAGREAVPLQGARFDLAVDGHSKGRLAGRAHGVDYLRVCADGRMELRPAPCRRQAPLRYASVLASSSG